MSKISNLFITYTKSLICFLFALISAFLIIIFSFDFANHSSIYRKELSEIQSAQGVIENIKTPKTNTILVISNCDKEFYIHTKNIEESSFKIGDSVILHYLDNNTR